MPSLVYLTFSHSNLLQVLSDANIATFCEKLRSNNKLRYLGLSGVQESYENIRKYIEIVENIPRLEKINISYNVVIGKAIREVVFSMVKIVKMTYRECLGVTVDGVSKEFEVDREFGEIAESLVARKGGGE